MVSLNKSVSDALRSLSRKPTTPEHFKAYFAEVSAEKNDRGAAILMAAIVENALQIAIERRLSIGEGEYDLLFGNDGSISTFSDKIRIGSALAIYGEKTKGTLNLLRHLRNAFAHAQVPINFMTEQVVKACNIMEVPSLPQSAGLMHYALDNATDSPSRAKYKRICDVLAYNLSEYSMDALQQFPDKTMPSLGDKYQYLVRPVPLP